MLEKLSRLPALPQILLLLALLLTMIPAGIAFGEDPVEEISTAAAAGDKADADVEAPAVGAPQDEPAGDAAAEPARESAKAPADEAAASDAEATAGADAGTKRATATGGANTEGPYDPNVDGSPSQNGNGGGDGDNRPCAGCVGNADDKNPPGQLPGPDDDGDNGYECDGNSGVGKTNPAHSGCPDPAPSIELVKDGPATARIGDTITYTFKVTNTGNTELTNVHITDPLLGTGSIAVTPSTLPAAGSGVVVIGTASREYTIKAGDVVNDNVHNVATAYGTPPSGSDVSDTDPHDVSIPDVPEVRKHTICHATPSAAKPYVVLEDSVKGVFDGHLGVTHQGELDIIPPFTYEGETYSQLWPEGQAIFENGCNVPDPLVPEITLIKEGPAGAQIGETITYTFKVTNTGETPLTNVHITDPLLGTGQIAVTPSTLAVRESGTATAQYTVDQADVVGLNVHNEATAIGTPPTGDPVRDTDPHDVAIVPPGPSAILLEKEGPDQAMVGDTITYTFDVTNIGATELSNVHITDPLLGTRQIPVTPSTLAPLGGTGVATATYTIEEAAVINQNLHNVATVHGTTPVGGTVTDDDPHDVTVPICCPDPGSIQLIKDGPAGADVGSTITYTFDVTNTGPVTLTDVHITDPLLGTRRIAVTPSTLPAGGTGTATAQYTVRQADVGADKMVHNVATVHGTTPDGRTLTDDDPHDVLTGTKTPPPAIFLEKDGPAGAENAGDVITYTFKVTNTGGRTLSNVHITDPMLTTRTIAVTPSTLAVNEVGTAQATYKVTGADVKALEIYNEATAHGTDPTGRNVEDDDDHTVIIPAGAGPGITLEKSGPASANVGDTITYRFTATNTGNTVLTNVTITDPMLGGELTVTPSTLEPGDVGTASGTYKVTAADGRRGEIFNTAIVTGDPPDGPPVTDRDTHRTDVPDEPVCCDPDDPDLPATGADVPTKLLIAALALMMGFGLLRVSRSTAPAGPATWSIQAPRLSGSQSPPPVHPRRPGGWSTPRIG